METKGTGFDEFVEELNKPISQPVSKKPKSLEALQPVIKPVEGGLKTLEVFEAEELEHIQTNLDIEVIVPNGTLAFIAKRMAYIRYEAQENDLKHERVAHERCMKEINNLAKKISKHLISLLGLIEKRC